MKELTVWMARSGLRSMRNVPLTVSTTATYFLFGSMVILGRSENVSGVAAGTGDEAGVSTAVGVSPVAGVSPVVGVSSAPSPSQPKARIVRSTDAPRSVNIRSIKNLQFVL